MDSSKNTVKSDSSSEENDNQEQAVTIDGGSTAKRSYECTYCKRGFTNAQALGGHMNIHRKDRAKAKQSLITSSSMTSKTTAAAAASSYFGSIFSNSELQQRNYHHQHEHMYLPPPPPPPPTSMYRENDFSAPRSSEISYPNEEGLGANLSLRMGSAHMEDREVIRRVDEGEEEVDLELRLGPDP